VRNRNAVKHLHFTKDTTETVDFLKHEIKTNKQKLSAEIDTITTVWRNLSELILAYLTVGTLYAETVWIA